MTAEVAAPSVRYVPGTGEQHRHVLAVIVKELPPVESTASHVAAPGAAEPPEVSAEPQRTSRAHTDEALS